MSNLDFESRLLLKYFLDFDNTTAGTTISFAMQSVSRSPCKPCRRPCSSDDRSSPRLFAGSQGIPAGRDRRAHASDGGSPARRQLSVQSHESAHRPLGVAGALAETIVVGLPLGLGERSPSGRRQRLASASAQAGKPSSALPAARCVPLRSKVPCRRCANARKHARTSGDALT